MKQWLGVGVKFCTILLVALTFLVGCNNATKTSESESDKNAKADPNSPTELTIFVDQTFWPLKDWTGRVPEEITKKTGVKLKVQVATDAQQLPLMISSGDMPDLVFTSTQFEQMSDSNISYTLDELIEKYNIDYKIDPMARVLNEGKDGKLYAIRNGFTNPEDFKNTPAALGNVPAYSLRPDILKELGDPKIESLDDLVNVLKQVKEKQPEMTPLVMNPLAIGQYFRVNFGAPYQGWTEVDGKVKYYINHPAQHDFYMFMNKLYREGLIKAENFTWSDPNKAKEMIINGQAFSINNVNAVPTINSELKAAGKDFTIAQTTKLVGENPGLYADSAGWSGTFITKDAKDPEAAIKFLEFMHSEEGQKLGLWGVEGEHWTMDKPMEEGGYPKFTFNSQDAIEQQKLGVVWWGLLADDGIYEQVQRYVPDSDTSKAMMDAKQYVKSNPLLGAVNPPAASDEQAIRANIDNMIKNEQTKIYLAKTEAEAEAAFENMMKTAESIGLSKLEDAVNKRYEDIVKRYNEVK
ncbi:extracellular solute-binding protein [Mesobacillus foraminis]|uniref:extracellular solute-binding protein n=1 Tax=Mesobacillus foraminis TaxID=279826 RepID=UPI001BEB407C|nr:extracellular solute-binding protein [Mesobacillus foraminis]MBT2757811.1 extracellular solute-binding protein [Mesobacillus foraminis]